MPRLVYIVTNPTSGDVILRGQLAYMRKQGFDVTLIASPGERLNEVARREGIQTVAIPMRREIDPRGDLIALGKLYRALRTLRPDIVNASTPKAGLLGMLAASFARVPIRIYLLRGLRLETASGLKRLVLNASERLASACAHKVVCISESLRQACVKLHLTPAQKTVVHGAGSSNGVDVERFRVDDAREEASAIRERLGIPATAPVIGFVGRLTRDKGIVELARVFQKVLSFFPDAWLLLVGDFEDGDCVPDDCVAELRNHPRVAISGFVAEPKSYYLLMDVLAFPTHREGFGNVAIEAALMEIPVVGFRVTGLVDAVHDGVTGTLAPPGDVDAFADAVVRYLDDRRLRHEHGSAGRQRTLRLFRQEVVWQAWRGLYEQLLEERGMNLPVPAAAGRIPGMAGHERPCRDECPASSPDSRD